jgi:ParB family chromosome partitioning protein
LGLDRSTVSNLIRLLELPDEALELMERDELSEGHGRALLLAGDHDARRRLAREAAARQWSVRELEHRARDTKGARGPKGSRNGHGTLHPDQEAALEGISDALAAALGREVEVTAASRGGYRAKLSFGSMEEALELAQRLRVKSN